MLPVVILVLFFIPTADAGPADYFRDYHSATTCIERLPRCKPDIGNISPIFQDQIFFNFTDEATDNICEAIGQAVSCIGSLASSSHTCQRLLEQRIGARIWKLEPFLTSMCSGQGRQDLDEVLRCANNKFIQRHYYGMKREREGNLKAQLDCLEYRSQEEMRCEKEKYECSTLQNIFRSLPNKANEYCGQSASVAVRRVLRHIYDVNTDMSMVNDCDYVPADLFM
uniref:Secreted protein n=1 Tax=Pinctada fucata TaxID=50426 RepID=A0A194AMX7_PINFU